MLYLVATPIGNLSDISLRALEVLRQVDYIASEDTRRTGILLKHFEIKKPQISCHEHNERQAAKRILRLLRDGNSVALVTNAGTPVLSDPGFILVREAIQSQVPTTLIPGPSAFLMALVLSGLPTHAFTFRGFAPHKKNQRIRFLSEDKASPHTLIFYESPYRLRKFLEDALSVFGNRPAALAKELTKTFESVKRGNLADLLEQVDETPKGEYVVVIAGAKYTSTTD